MWLSEALLYMLVKRLYKSEACNPKQLRDCVSTKEDYHRHRTGRFPQILEQAKRFGISLTDKAVVDFGCADGAITHCYLAAGAREVVGVDIDAVTIARATNRYAHPKLSFHLCINNQIPLDSESVDIVLSYDVFEHVVNLAPALSELHRILRSGGKIVIGTCGWYHPFTPHLFATMPVPWAHIIFSERTLLRVCRRVYTSSWYMPAMYDLDEEGNKKPDKYLGDHMPLDYVNKLLTSDFERIFRASKFQFEFYPVPFSSRHARWTRSFLKVPILREFLTGYLWVVLAKGQDTEDRHDLHGIVPDVPLGSAA